MALAQSQVERIAYLWAQKVPQTTIAAAVGISPGRLSQLLESSDELKAAITAVEAQTVDKDLKRLNKLEDVEERLLATIPALIDPDFLSLTDAMRALSIVDEIKRRQKGLAPATAQGMGVGIQLNLSLVAQTAVDVVLNTNNAILELGGTDVTPMSRHLVGGFLDDLSNAPRDLEPDV